MPRTSEAAHPHPIRFEFNGRPDRPPITGTPIERRDARLAIGNRYSKQRGDSKATHIKAPSLRQ